MRKINDAVFQLHLTIAVRAINNLEIHSRKTRKSYEITPIREGYRHPSSVLVFVVIFHRLAKGGAEKGTSKAQLRTRHPHPIRKVRLTTTSTFRDAVFLFLSLSLSSIQPGKVKWIKTRNEFGIITPLGMHACNLFISMETSR